MNQVEKIINHNELVESLEILRNDIANEQKKGLPFILASVVIWMLVSIVSCLDLTVDKKNILVFCCSCPLMPLAWFIGKRIKVNIFSNKNPLGNLGFLFTCNQLIYLLIVMWVFSAMPDKMVMVYAMVFGAHLLPYSWLYKSSAYKVFSIILPIVALVIGNIWTSTEIAIVFMVLEVILSISLIAELRKNL